MRHFSGGALCALLLIFCINARLVLYELHKPALKLALTQSYLDGKETQKELVKTIPLVVCAGVVAVLFLLRNRAILIQVVLPSSSPFKGFNLESSLRPPPAQ